MEILLVAHDGTGPQRAQAERLIQEAPRLFGRKERGATWLGSHIAVALVDDGVDPSHRIWQPSDDGERFLVGMTNGPSNATKVLGSSERLAPVDHVFESPTLLEAQVDAILRRGTDHEAGPIEQALRAVGREIDVQGLREVTAVQGPGNDRWSVWHHRITDGHVEVICLTTEDLAGFGLEGHA